MNFFEQVKEKINKKINPENVTLIDNSNLHVKHKSFDAFAQKYGGTKGTKLGEKEPIPAGEKIYIPKNNRLGRPPGIYKWNVGQGKFNPHTLE